MALVKFCIEREANSMKYLIISTYDSCDDWEIKTNNASLTKEEFEDDYYIEGLEIVCNRLRYDMLEECDIPLENYDFVVLCVNGSVQVLKDTVNRNGKRKITTC